MENFYTFAVSDERKPAARHTSTKKEYLNLDRLDERDCKKRYMFSIIVMIITRRGLRVQRK
jgi:hypothetical protein